MLAALAAAALLGACAPTSKPILLSEEPAPPDKEKEWAKYGAYYLTDELFVEASYYENPFSRGMTGKYIVNKKLKILSREGVEHGSVEIPVYAGRVSKRSLVARDSTGQPFKLDTAAIFRGYYESGKLIFPNVTPGCVLEIHLEFEDFRPITVLEHWFTGDIPVAHGRMTFSSLNQFEYDYASYGPLLKGGKTQREKEGESSQLEYRTWEVRDARPRSRVDFQDEVDATEPRVSLVMRQFNNFPVITSWEKLSESYEEAALKPSFFNSTRKLKKKVDELTKNLKTDREKAQACFQWVQDNVSYKSSGLGTIDPDAIMASGQGNMWDITVVLREMFDHLGLKTAVIVTRPRSMGGFDSKFPTPLQLAVPLVTVEVDGRTLTAFPYARGAALGEYPDDYFGLSSLSLANQDSVKVPEYSGGPSYSHSTFRIDPSFPEADQKMDQELGGYLAFYVRNSLLAEKKSDLKDVFQQTLTRLGTSNALKTCQVEDLNSRGKPMRAKLVFANPTQSIERKGETQLKLSHVFSSYFSSYDTSRATGFKNGLEGEFIERVEIAKPAGRKVEPNIPCETASNTLFKVECRTEENDTALVFTRNVVLHKAKLAPSQMRDLYPQIAALNRIEDARVIVRGETAGRAEAAAGKRPPRKR
jgi:hypothetical protein